jgi:hypothetical protein
LPGSIVVQNPEPFAHQHRKDGLRNKIVNSFFGFGVQRSAFGFALAQLIIKSIRQPSPQNHRKGETRVQLIYDLDFGYLKPEVFSELDAERQRQTLNQPCAGLPDLSGAENALICIG